MEGLISAGITGLGIGTQAFLIGIGIVLSFGIKVAVNGLQRPDRR